MEIQQINNNLIAEVYQLKSSNHRLSLEIDRLIKVDQELVKTQEALKNANNELATKEILVSCITAVKIHLNNFALIYIYGILRGRIKEKKVLYFPYSNL